MRTKNWLITTYDENDSVTDSFVIENRTERQAESEAIADNSVKHSHDWTMSDLQRVQFEQAYRHAESIGLTLFKFDGITYRIVK